MACIFYKKYIQLNTVQRQNIFHETNELCFFYTYSHSELYAFIKLGLWHVYHCEHHLFIQHGFRNWRQNCWNPGIVFFLFVAGHTTPVAEQSAVSIAFMHFKICNTFLKINLDYMQGLISLHSLFWSKDAAVTCVECHLALSCRNEMEKLKEVIWMEACCSKTFRHY